MPRRTARQPDGARQRTCPQCNATPDNPCRTPKGKPFKGADGATLHHRRELVLVPLSHLAVASGGTGHVRNAKRGAHGLCGKAVTLQSVPNTTRVECRECYSLKAHMTAHPQAPWPPGTAMLPPDGGVPEDSTL
jgi:hypothetical protein